MLLREKSRVINAFVLGLMLLIAAFATAQTQAAFDGTDKWKAAVKGADPAALKAIYSTNPPAKAVGADQKPTADISLETDFWEKLMSSEKSDLDVNVAGEQDQQGLHVVRLQISMKVKTADGARTRYVMEQQAWQPQADGWLRSEQHTSELQ